MKYGYNLFSAWQVVKDRDTLVEVMKSLKNMGYDGVEFFLYYGVPAEEMKAIVDELGLEPFSTHPRMIRFFENLDEEIAYAKTVGIKTLVMPHVLDEERNEEYYKKLIAAIPEWKKKCDAAGLRLAWHNHDFEFQPYGNEKYLMDVLMNTADIDYEIDTFWTTLAGLDTLAYMDKYKDRIHYVHFKDYSGKNGPTFTDIAFCAVGEGLIPTADIAKKAKENGVEWAVAEQDLHTKDVMEDAKSSIDYMKKQFES